MNENLSTEGGEVEYRFHDRHEFIKRHEVGTQAEFDLEAWEIKKFNNTRRQFIAWPRLTLPTSRTEDPARTKNAIWVFLVNLAGLQERLLEEGELCQIKIWGNDTRYQWWNAERIPMSYSLLGTDEDWEKYGAFKVTIPNHDEPIHLLDPVLQANDKFEHNGNLALTNANGLRVIFQLKISSATVQMELKALKDVRETDPEGKRGSMFSYWLSLQNPKYFINLMEHFPPLQNGKCVPQPLRSRLWKELASFDSHQESAFKQLLTHIPCGICTLPGGPGAGKTRFNLVVAAMTQAQDAIRLGPQQDIVSRRVKILYLLDINKPLSDIASRMVSLYRDLGMQKLAIRMYSWRYNTINVTQWAMESERMRIDFNREKLRNPGPGEIEQSRMKQRYPVNETIKILDFSPKFIEAGLCSHIDPRDGCLAPTLDEAAWQFYEQHRDDKKYRYLSAVMDETLNSGWATGLFKFSLNALYQDVVEAADFIATTPVAAGKSLPGKFSPDLVFFDEAPHAREASTLSALTNFSPIAWIFTGDPRQTRPFVRHVPGHPELYAQPTPNRSKRNPDDKPLPNPWRAQMQVSMMERADNLGVIKNFLLINHRARAGLHKLPSSLFYDGKMETALDKHTLYPDSTKHLMKWISTLLKSTCQIPRVRVNLDCSPSDVQMKGTSSYNTKHLNWVMKRVKELATDPRFMQPDGKERGTILIMTPYKEAFFQYKDAIRAMSRRLEKESSREREHSICKVEARTVDTAQGHEADVVFLDLVRLHITPFLGDRNRLNVAMTRARQAEFLIADDGMIDSEGWSDSSIMQEIFAGQTHVYNEVESILSDMTLVN